MNPERNWVSLLVCLLAFQLSGCASLPGWMTASKSNPKPRASNVETKLDIARLHEHQGKYTQARELYLSILENDPQNKQACHRMAVVHTRLGNPEESISYYQRAVELDPKNPELLSDFGYALFLSDDLLTAEEALQQALAIDPNHNRSIGNLAMVRGHQGHFKESLSLFREIVPEAQAYANLGYIHVQRGEGQLAIQRYGQALELDDTLDSAADALVQIAKIQNRAQNNRTPGYNNQSSPNSYVATARNFESYATETTEPQIETPNTEFQGNSEADSPTPGQWWNQSSDFVLAGASNQPTAGAEITAEAFPEDEFSVDETPVDQMASDESSAEEFSVVEQSIVEYPVNNFSADELVVDEFVPAPHPLAEDSQSNPFEARLDESPGVVRLGSNRDDSDDLDKF